MFLTQGKEDLAARALRRYLELDPGTPKRSDIETVLAELSARGRISAKLPPSVASESRAGSDTLENGGEGE